MKRYFILTAALFLFVLSGSAQLKVWKNDVVTFMTDPAEVDSITFGVPYQCLALNEISGDKGWIEIYNKSEFSISLEGVKIMLIENGNATELVTFGQESISGKKFSVKDVQGLSNTEDLVITLQTPDGAVIDKFDSQKELEGEKHADNGSYSRIPDGIGEWKIISEPTRNEKNNYGKAEMPNIPITMLHEKVWDATVAIFPPDEAIYLLTENNQLVYDPQKGDYVYITAREFGEKFRDRYNEENGTNVTIEDVLRFDYEDGHYFEISFKDDMTCAIWDGVYSSGGQVAVMVGKGKYRFDEETGIIYMLDTESNSLYDKEFEIQVAREKDNPENLTFEIIKKKILDPQYSWGFDYDMFGYSFYDYDQENLYYPAKKIIYHCVEAEVSRH